MRPYTLENNNRHYLAVKNICRQEMHPGNTICFSSEVDLSSIERVRSAREKQGAAKPSYTSFVAKAVALALKEFPEANRRGFRLPWGSRIVRFHDIDIAVAFERDVPEAPMVACIDIIRGVDILSLEAITTRLREFGSATLENNKQWRAFHVGISRFPAWIFSLVMRLHALTPAYWHRYRGGACLISSPAKYGVHQMVGTWSHPLGVSFGQVKWSPVVAAGEVVARKTFTFTLNWDRTIMAGAPAAKFFKQITFLLENAEQEIQ